MIEATVFSSPIGPLTLAARSGRLGILRFGDDLEYVRALLGPPDKAGPAIDPAGAVSALRRYFAGALDALDDLPLDMAGTPFQQRVWTALRSVTPGKTASYSDRACAIGAPAAVRAVGAANGANPIAVVVPCHRIIGSNGTLTGYGGGLRRKEWLLRHEGRRLF